MLQHTVVEIDGGMMEGGGQILRMALSLSALQGIPIHVSNIRAGRPNPGLRAQHLAGLHIIRDISAGRLDNAEVGSTEITFCPGKLRGGEVFADVQTAGSVGLLLQVALPCVFFSPGDTHMRLKGGTNADMAPQIDYTIEVFRPVLQKFGATFDCSVIKRGYFPKGGGEIHVRSSPVKMLQPVTMLDPGKITRIRGWAFVAGVLPMKMAHKMADSARNVLHWYFPGVDINIERYQEYPDRAVGNGSGINIIAETSTGCILGGSGLGKRELYPEDVGEKAAKEIVQAVEDGACVDLHTQDQIILFMALSSGKSQVRSGPLTLHTKTAIHMCHLMTKAKFNTVDQPGSRSCIIECDGIGLRSH